jgi:DNA invertase Pin-like site-specific DNA recombinase
MANVKEPIATKAQRRSSKRQIVGYVRVSTFEQKDLRQLEGVKLVRKFLDKASGKDVKRAQLEALLSYVRDGDTVICRSMDRLGRNDSPKQRPTQVIE